MYILVEQMKRSYLTSYSMISLILILLLTNTDRGVLSSSITLPKRVVVIGGGAAGYFAAIECARVLSESSVRQLVEVVVLEASSQPLSKVKISGGGRCNVMHDPTKGLSIIAKGYPRGSQELLGPFSKRFGPSDTMNWFKSRGVDLKTEEDGRVFPCSDSSQTIIDTLSREAQKLKVSIRTNTAVTAIQSNDNEDISTSSDNPRYNIVCTQSSSGDKVVSSLPCDKVICATGSSRQAYKILQSLGHSLIEPLPSLFSFKIKDESVHELAGTAIESAAVKIVLSAANKKDSKLKKFLRPSHFSQYEQKGPLLFTHQGMSGPAILRLSAYGAKILHGMEYQFNISVNYLPQYDSEQIIEALMQEKKDHPTRFVTKAFPGYLLPSDGTTASNLPVISRKLWLHILQKANIIGKASDDGDRADSAISKGNDSKSDATDNKELAWAKMSRNDINAIVNQITQAQYPVHGRGEYREEFVTCGGIDLKQINFDTLESKVREGLFLAGEVIDIDGITGGYNFQSAWTTGWIAGHHAAKNVIESMSQIFQNSIKV